MAKTIDIGILYRPIVWVIASLCLSAGPAWAADTQSGPIYFAADLSADEESAPTYSDGSGRADFTLDRETLTFEWVVTYEGLTSPIKGAHVHGPQRPGTNAGILFDLAEANGLKSPIRGSIVLNEGLLEYLLAGRLYVNLHTTRYEDGELRGQIGRLRHPPGQ